MRLILLTLMVLTCGSTLSAVEFPLSGTTLAGTKLEIDPVKRGRPLVLVFWASWCGVCVREMPALRRFHREVGERLDLVSCTIDTEVDAARASAARNQLGYPVILDGDLAIGGKFAVDATPTMILFAADGKELARGRSLGQLTEALTRLGITKP
ncbi:MAG: TlpA family protein disulfide reductase [Planctomycetes bacterium]|nr:TlpA family protein disulfide reductase [Planctomycetota bacterium]